MIITHIQCSVPRILIKISGIPVRIRRLSNVQVNKIKYHHIYMNCKSISSFVHSHRWAPKNSEWGQYTNSNGRLSKDSSVRSPANEIITSLYHWIVSQLNHWIAALDYWIIGLLDYRITISLGCHISWPSKYRTIWMMNHLITVIVDHRNIR